jgi:hypothetical protein
MRHRALMLMTGLPVLLLGPAAAEAACGGSSPTLIAASASRTDVLDCVNAAVSGDTINVPAGTASYSTPIALPGTKDITLRGATTITCSGTAGSPGYACTAGATNTSLTCADGCFLLDLGASQRISGFTMTTAGNELISSVGAQHGGKHFRIDHNRLVTTGGWSPIRFKNNDSAAHAQGIWDHNIFEDGISIHTNGTLCQLEEGCGSFQHTLWAQDSLLGDSAHVVYVEANHFVTSAGTVNFADGNYGARAVLRFNKTEGPSISGFEYHSVQGENRGYQRWETYHNAFVDLDGSDSCFFGMAFIRAGTGVWFNNAMSGAISGCNNSISIDNVRSADDDPIPGAGLCNGSSPWDQNTPGQLGWHCRDQIGIGRDVSTWTHNPPAPWNQVLKPAYLWGNTRGGSIVTASVLPQDRNPLHIQANREYYDHSTASGSPQTAGVRVGTIANRPAGCTAGVGYWATDEGEWNSLQPGPDGRLYKCSPANNWSLYYVPYSYPHPWTMPPCAMSIRPLTLPTGRVGLAYSQAFTASGGASPITFSQSGALPAGLTFDAGTATLSGTPSQSGSFVITVGATDTAACAASRTYNLAIASAVNLTPAALAVDAAGNGVLDPNQTVVMDPSWSNFTGAPLNLAGALGSFIGAAGATYTIADGSASYGNIANTATGRCGTTGDCYSVAVTAAQRPEMHWDASVVESLSTGGPKAWTLHVGGSFNDVPAGNPFYRFIEILLHRGITVGCGGSSYCPAASTARDQMAVFVLLAKEGAGYAPPACSPPNIFNDVPETSPFCRFIEELANRGVVGGCGGGRYCPANAVTREQMAVFVLRTLDPALNPPACTTPMFNDVPASSPFCRWIEELARRGVVGGCGGGVYCPASAVTREQMGVFLSATFGLQLYGP